MPAVIETKATTFYAARSSYAAHVDARTNAKSGYRQVRKAMKDRGEITDAEFEAGNVPYTEAEWIDEQGSLDGPIIATAAAGVEIVASNDVVDGELVTVKTEQPFDEREESNAPFPWVEITEDEYNAAQGEDQGNNDNNGNNGKAGK